MIIVKSEDSSKGQKVMMIDSIPTWSKDCGIVEPFVTGEVEPDFQAAV